MDIIAIVLSLFLLVTFAYRGFSVILFAPIFALFAASFSGLPILPGYLVRVQGEDGNHCVGIMREVLLPGLPPRCRLRQGHGRNGHGPQYCHGNHQAHRER